MPDPITPAPAPPPASQPARAGRREWTALAVLCLPLLIVSMDVSVLFFAVPHIAEALEPTANQVLWIFDIYGFVLAGLLLTMGSLADRIGRRRLLLIGAVAFAAASVLAAYAPAPSGSSPRGPCSGVGGATLMPSTLALVRNLFTDQARARQGGRHLVGRHGRRRRHRPGHLGRAARALLVGLGLPRQRARHGALLSSRPSCCRSRGRGPSRVDLVSSVLSLLAILPVIHVLKSTAADGWSAGLLPYAVVGVLAGVAFVRRQSRISSPMVDLTLFRHVASAAASRCRSSGCSASWATPSS